jgi:electron transport complex protein RnfD
MAQRVMIMPSGRTRYIKDANQKQIRLALFVVAVLMVLTNYYLFSFMHAIKQAIMIVLSVIVVRETEILYYTHFFDIRREEAKELIQKSYPIITGLIYVLLIPIGAPFWLILVGAFMGTAFGKLIFGGYHHMVFHTSLVGYLFVTLGWVGLADSAEFVSGFGNYLIELVFNNTFFNDTLAIGGMFAPDAASSLVDGSYSLASVVFGLVPGVVGNGIVLLGILVYFIAKKVVNWIIPVSILTTFLLLTTITGIVNQADLLTLLPYQLFSGSLLFVVLFVSTDPITTPIPTAGKLIYGVLVGVITLLIRNGGTYEEGIVFAVLFMSMLTPMLNTE